MKNHDLLPAAINAPPVECAFSQVSKLQTMEFGLHCSQVNAATVAEALSMILSFSFATCATASATEEVGTSIVAAIP